MRFDAIKYLFCTACLSSCPAIVPAAAQDAGHGNFIAYAEFFGHNYYSFSDGSPQDGIFSLNGGYRQAIIADKIYAQISVGWGTYKKESRLNYLPVEIVMQFGKAPHYFELGYAQTYCFGQQTLFYSSGSHGIGEFRNVNEAFQLVPHIGYTYAGEKGLFVRAMLSPHYVSKSLKYYNGNKLEVTGQWMFFGVSLGFLI